jgi:phage-related protein
MSRVDSANRYNGNAAQRRKIRRFIAKHGSLNVCRWFNPKGAFTA